jgi:hypothetical protein
METPRDSRQRWEPAAAASAYQSRRNRSAKKDGFFGAMLAGYVQTEKHFRDWMRRAVKQTRRGQKPERPESLPEWIRAEALPLARQFALRYGADLPLVGNRLSYDELVADPPMPSLCAMIDAQVVSEGSMDPADLKKWGEDFVATFVDAEVSRAIAEVVAPEELTASAAARGRCFVNAFRHFDQERKIGRSVDGFGIAFITGVDHIYASADLGHPKPRDLAEIAVAWGLDRGPRDEVIQRWKSKACQCRRRKKRGGKPAAT